MKPNLNSRELERYSRQIILDEIGASGQAALKNARVLVVGAGGLGCPCLLHLASCGVGRLAVMDDDRVARSNLHRQVLFGESDIGRLKVEAAAERLQALNPDIDVAPRAERFITANALEAVSAFDIVIDASDNFGTRYLVNDACVVAGKPWIGASLFRFSGQIAVYNAELPDGSRGPTYRCIFPEPPPPEMVPSCAELGVLGVVPGLLGTLQANECLKLLLSIGEPLSGRLLVIDTLTLTIRRLEFDRNESAVRTALIREPSYYQPLCALPTGAPARHELFEITLDELRAIPERELCLIDVRESAERDRSSIGGEHIPLATLAGRIEQIPDNRKLVLYCRSGARSAKGAAILKEARPKQPVYSLKGGLLAYGLDTN